MTILATAAATFLVAVVTVGFVVVFPVLMVLGRIAETVL